MVKSIIDSIEFIENSADYKGMIIAHDAELCAGANLQEMAVHVQTKNYERIDAAIDRFQKMTQSIYYAKKPVIPVVQGRVFGGGCEIAMAGTTTVAAAETYIGLVELGVGLIPAGGGTYRMAKHASDVAAEKTALAIQPFLLQNWKTVAMATVSSSALEAVEKRLLPANSVISMNFDHRLEIAKSLVLNLSHRGYLPPPRRPITVLGKPSASAFEAFAYNMLEGGFISEYDAYLANQLGHVITGGEITAPGVVSEEYMLELERKVFVSLLKQEKTLARIESILNYNKPLRN